MSGNVLTTNHQLTSLRHQVALLGSEAEGQFSLRIQFPEPGEGTPLHAHTEQAETFHVISGRIKFQAGDQVLVGEPGFTVFIPKGTPHCFLNIGKEQGHMISILTPGVHDGFLTNIPAAEKQGASAEILSAMAEQHGARILGPKLTHDGE
ncbi:cupin domain-containing protein [Endozoicomonadaceae bacterium StTr2]